eukprot:3340094-Prymnesium_polylepis.1
MKRKVTNLLRRGSRCARKGWESASHQAAVYTGALDRVGQHGLDEAAIPARTIHATHTRGRHST